MDLATLRHDDLMPDLHTTVERLLACTGHSPLVVDHTRPEIGIPVVRVVCPGLRFDPAHGRRTP